jgi:Kef-type K+ transport system membrane component KefB
VSRNSPDEKIFRPFIQKIAKLHRLSIGIGMIPRGEVGLIFANIGLTLVVRGERIIDSGTYSAVVIMVMLTTLITPPALKWSLSRRRSR